MHYFSTAFLGDMAVRMRTEARYHLARKAIPSASGPVQVNRQKCSLLKSILVWCSYPSTSVAQHDAELELGIIGCLLQADGCPCCTYVKLL